MTVSEYRIELEQRKGREAQLRDELKKTNSGLRKLRKERRIAEKAQAIIQMVAQQTQQELQYKISEIVTTALASVFPDPYTFEVEFVIARGKSEANLWFVRRGDRIHPMSAAGGGAVDVACFALRLALWNLSQPKLRNTIILDEPFRYLSSNLQDRAASMLKEISSQLGIQIIMISHIEDII
jgi:ABC-type dipeptide/oligopeptide/nickel transport system ATPase subunit